MHRSDAEAGDLPLFYFYFYFCCPAETLSSCMVNQQGFESLYRMRRSTFSYICSLVRIPFFEDMMTRDHTFVDGKMMSLQDGVAIALRVLNSGEPSQIVGSSLGVNESTVSLVTQRFVEAMWERAYYHISWPGSTKMKNIKRKFDKIHGLPNCCGVVHTTHIAFGSSLESDSRPMQIVVDSNLSFSEIWVEWPGMNQSSILHESWVFKSENGSNLKLSEGSYVGEYIIGDAGYPLLPWLLTPYHLEDKDLSADLPPWQAEFNRRHSSASTLTHVALGRLKDTWNILDRALGSCPPLKTIYAC